MKISNDGSRSTIENGDGLEEDMAETGGSVPGYRREMWWGQEGRTWMPEARMPAGSVQRRPSIHSMTSTRGQHRSRRTHGIFTVGSLLKFSRKSCAPHAHRHHLSKPLTATKRGGQTASGGCFV